MKTQDAIVISVGMIVAVVLMICMCGLLSALFIDNNTPKYGPVPGTTTYDWQ